LKGRGAVRERGSNNESEHEQGVSSSRYQKGEKGAFAELPNYQQPGLEPRLGAMRSRKNLGGDVGLNDEKDGGRTGASAWKTSWGDPENPVKEGLKSKGTRG